MFKTFNKHIVSSMIVIGQWPLEKGATKSQHFAHLGVDPCPRKGNPTDCLCMYTYLADGFNPSEQSQILEKKHVSCQ